MNRYLTKTTMVGVALLFSACTMDLADADDAGADGVDSTAQAEVDERDTEAAPATGNKALPRYITATWTNGQGAIPLASFSDYFCFLSKITGTFAGQGETVDVYPDNGWWYIRGGSGQPQLSGTATCVNFTAFSNAAGGHTQHWEWARSWSNNDVYVAPISEMTWLSAVQGGLRGGAEWLNIYPANGSWRFNLHAGAGASVQGRAWSARVYDFAGRTRNPNYAGSFYQISPLDGRTYDNADIDLGSSLDRVCYLLQVAGRFDGYGEWAEVKRHNNRWYLRVESTGFRNEVNATAQCVSLY